MKRARELAFVAGSLLLLGVTVNSFSYASANEYPQTEVDSASNEAKESGDKQLALAKYNFMLNAKQEAEEEYVSRMQGEIQEKLNNSDMEDEEAMAALENIMVEKAALEKEQTEKANAQANESLEALVTAVADLQETASAIENNEIDVEPNESVVVASSGSDPTSEALIAGVRVDDSYSGSQINITGQNRVYLENLVQSEAGNQGFIGAALVAQTIHDTMLMDDCYDVATIKSTHAYEGSLYNTPCDDVKRAVEFIFDKGGMAVQHRLIYFYAPKLVNSSFHESQKFIIEYGGHRFFDRW